jgi:hypothetical protein
MKDFTLVIYDKLLTVLRKQGFKFNQYNNFKNINESQTKIILRHDVDALKQNSLHVAKILAKKEIKGCFYFRIGSGSYDELVINEIFELGHEVGYHYEDLSLASQRQKIKITRQKSDGAEDYEKYLVDIAIVSFEKNLKTFRKIAPVKTICMHGSPMSRWDSRLLWKYYDYRDFGIVAEPYFDVNFEEMLYLTDTGRRWNGESVSVRDKAQGSEFRVQSETRYNEWKVKPLPGSLMNMTRESMDFQNRYHFRSTSDIISAAKRGALPNKIMMTFHPQRWTDKPIPWVKELVWQNVKNLGKYFLVKLRE